MSLPHRIDSSDAVERMGLRVDTPGAAASHESVNRVCGRPWAICKNPLLMRTVVQRNVTSAAAHWMRRNARTPLLIWTSDLLSDRPPLAPAVHRDLARARTPTNTIRS